MSSPSSMRYLTADELWAMNDGILRQAGVYAMVLDRGALESAAMRPQTLAFYAGADLIQQAAAPIAGVALNHAFLDGNKRTAAIAGATFLDLNGWRLAYHADEYGRQLETFILAGDREVALATFIAWLRAHLVPR